MTKTVIRQITPTLHTFSRPFSRFGLLKIGARSAVLILSDGSLAITSPVSLEEDDAPLHYIKNQLGGQVKLIIAPDLAHWLSVSSWSKEFPKAKLIGVEGHDKKTGSTVHWDTLFTSRTDDEAVLAEYGVTEDLAFAYFAGFVGRDLVTLHKPSKAIIEADLIFNLPAGQQYGKVPGGLTSLMNVLRIDSQWSRRFLWYVGSKDEQQMSSAARIVSDWDFHIIVPCHGDIVEKGGKDAWDWVFARFLE